MNAAMEVLLFLKRKKLKREPIGVFEAPIGKGETSHHQSIKDISNIVSPISKAKQAVRSSKRTQHH